MSKKKVIRLRIANSHESMDAALEFAVERGLNRCDKYNEVPLTKGQRLTLHTEIEQSFWLALMDAGLEVK